MSSLAVVKRVVCLDTLQMMCFTIDFIEMRVSYCKVYGSVTNNLPLC